MKFAPESVDLCTFPLCVCVCVCVCSFATAASRVCAFGTTKAVLLREISQVSVFSKELFGLALTQPRMCRLITQPGDQWAYPGIVLLSVFDGVSLQAQRCRQNDVLLFLT